MKRKLLFLIFFIFVAINVKAKDIDTLFNEVAPNDVFSINAFKPICNGNDGEGNLWCPELDFYPMNHIRMMYPNDDYYADLQNCNEELTECDLSIDIPDYETNNGPHKTKKVQVIWKEDIPKVKEKMNLYAEKVKNNTHKDDMGFAIYDITDLELINYMYNTGNYNKNNGFNLVANYAKSLRKEFENSNLTYYMDIRLGDDYEMYNYVGGELVLMYDGIMGKLVSVGIQYKNVLYIPDETDNTPEAYIAAAKKRISEYLGNNNFKIEMVGKRSELIPETHEDPFDFSLLGNEEKMGDYYYKITINNNSDFFAILRDSSKMEELKTVSTDIITNVTVSTTDASVPLDTTVKVEEVLENSEEYQKIIDFLKQDKFRAFNISLHSNDHGIIIRLENGVFKIIIPFGKEYIGKKIKAYYLKEDNTKEEFDVTMDNNGNAEFETSHFSTYILAEEEETQPDVSSYAVDETEEKNTEDQNTASEKETERAINEEKNIDVVGEQVPQTYDGIINYVILLILSFSSLLLIVRKRFN